MAGVHRVCTQTRRSNEAARCNDNPAAIELSADLVTRCTSQVAVHKVFSRHEVIWVA